MTKDTNVLHLEVFALGRSLVLKNGAEISKADWGWQKTREVFLYLIDATPIDRHKILEKFWGDKSHAQAANNFHQTLFRLRRAMGQEILLVENQEYRLTPQIQISYDVADFESKAKGALALSTADVRRLEPLAEALVLYQGEYLADLPVDWAIERRDTLNTLYITVARTYADELMLFTRYSEAKEVLTKALKVEPLRDDLHERMLLCLNKMGRHHEVVNYYLRYTNTLRAELGLDPPPEMQTLYARLIQ